MLESWFSRDPKTPLRSTLADSVALLTELKIEARMAASRRMKKLVALLQQHREFSEVRNCVSGFSRELAVPPSKLVLLFNAAFCHRDRSLSYYRETR